MPRRKQDCPKRLPGEDDSDTEDCDTTIAAQTDNKSSEGSSDDKEEQDNSSTSCDAEFSSSMDPEAGTEQEYIEPSTSVIAGQDLDNRCDVNENSLYNDTDAKTNVNSITCVSNTDLNSEESIRQDLDSAEIQVTSYNEDSATVSKEKYPVSNVVDICEPLHDSAAKLEQIHSGNSSLSILPVDKCNMDVSEDREPHGSVRAELTEEEDALDLSTAEVISSSKVARLSPIGDHVLCSENDSAQGSTDQPLDLSMKPQHPQIKTEPSENKSSGKTDQINVSYGKEHSSRSSGSKWLRDDFQCGLSSSLKNLEQRFGGGSSLSSFQFGHKKHSAYDIHKQSSVSQLLPSRLSMLHSKHGYDSTYPSHHHRSSSHNHHMSRELQKNSSPLKSDQAQKLSPSIKHHHYHSKASSLSLSSSHLPKKERRSPVIPTSKNASSVADHQSMSPSHASARNCQTVKAILNKIKVPTSTAPFASNSAKPAESSSSDGKHIVYKCSCYKSFRTLHELSIHLQESGHEPVTHKAASMMDYPKLVRGQDMWLNQGTEQTKQILRCMQCGDSFKSLPELTVHMMETQHYMKIVNTEHGKKAHRCSAYCEKEFETECVFKCKICKESFSDMSGLANHMMASGHHRKQFSASRASGTPTRHSSPDMKSHKRRYPVSLEENPYLANQHTLNMLLDYKSRYPTMVKHPLSNGNTSGSEDELSSLSDNCITCENCGQKIEMSIFVEHVRMCLKKRVEQIHASLSKKLGSDLDHELNEAKQHDSNVKKEPHSPVQRSLPESHSSPSEGGYLAKEYSDIMSKMRRVTDESMLLCDSLKSHRPQTSSIHVHSRALSPKYSADTLRPNDTHLDLLRPKDQCVNSVQSPVARDSVYIKSECHSSSDSDSDILHIDTKDSASTYSRLTTGRDMPMHSPIVQSHDQLGIPLEKTKSCDALDRSDSVSPTPLPESASKRHDHLGESTLHKDVSPVTTNKWRRLDIIDPDLPSDSDATGSSALQDMQSFIHKSFTDKSNNNRSKFLGRLDMLYSEPFSYGYQYYGNGTGFPGYRSHSPPNMLLQTLEVAASQKTSTLSDMIKKYSSQVSDSKHAGYNEMSKTPPVPDKCANIDSELEKTPVQENVRKRKIELVNLDSKQQDAPKVQKVHSSNSKSSDSIVQKYITDHDEVVTSDKTSKSSALTSLSSFVYGQPLNSEHPLDSLQRLITMPESASGLRGGQSVSNSLCVSPNSSDKLAHNFSIGSKLSRRMSDDESETDTPIYKSDHVSVKLETAEPDMMTSARLLSSPSGSNSDGEFPEYKCRACNRKFASKGSYRYHLSRCHLSNAKKYGIRDTIHASPFVYLPLDHTSNLNKYYDQSDKYSKFYKLAQELASEGSPATTASKT